MLWLPALSSGGGGRLPLASASVSTLIDALLACPAEQAAGRLSSAVERDPGLALWAVCRASRDSSDPLRTTEQLGEWLARRASEVLVWPEAEAEPLPTEARDEARRLALASVETATLAHELALYRGAPQIAAEECYLLGLLHNAEQWLALPPSLPSGDDNSHCSHASFPFANAAGSRNADVLPGWLIEAIGRSSQDDPVSTAREMLSGQSELPPSLSFDRQAVAAQVQATFAPAAADALPQCLPALARKLARLRQLEDSFEQQLETEKLEAMAEFAAGAGHEINNPIAVIAGRAQLFLREERDPERRRELAVLNGQAMRVYEMISDMMLFARPPKPKPANCDLAMLIERLLAELRAEFAERRIEVQSEGTHESLVLQADVDQLGVALRALLENSLEALSHGGHVQVSLRRMPSAGLAAEAGRWVEIAVRDNGPGIALEVRRRLFDPFYSGRAAGRGLGMGLAKCWRIISNHGGRIDVESEPGRGATFIVRLPLQVGSAKSEVGERKEH